MAALHPLDLVILSRVIGIVMLLLIIAVFYKVTERFDKSKMAFSIALLLLLANPATAVHAVSGMSTLLFGLLFLVSVYFAYLVYEDPSRRNILVFSLSSLLMTLTRSEGGVATLFMAVFLYWTHRKGIMEFVGVYVAPIAVYLGWKQLTFGSIVPLPFMVKTVVGFSLRGIPQLMRNLAYLSPFLLAICIGVGVRNSPHLRRFVTIAIAASFGMLLVFQFSALTQNIMQRFYFPVFMLAYLLAGISVTKITDKRMLMVGMAIILALSNVAFVDEMIDMNEYGIGMQNGYVALGKALKGSELSVACADAGALAYYSDVTFYDMAGLNDAEIAKTKVASPEYVESIKPDLLVFSHALPKYANYDIFAALLSGWKSVPFVQYGIDNGYEVLRTIQYRGDMYLIIIGHPDNRDYINGLEISPGY